MLDQPVNVAVIVGSTRVGRFAPVVAQWFTKQAAAHDAVVTSVIDLDDVRLPERLGTASGPDVDELANVTRQLAAADAFVVITPEYNHSYPAVLKTFIDWHFNEWQAKPVGFVSYGGQSGGLRAVEHLRQVFAELHAVTVRDTVSFHGAWNQFHPDGTPKDPEGCNGAAQKMIAQLAWWAVALAEARDRHPYAA